MNHKELDRIRKIVCMIGIPIIGAFLIFMLVLELKSWKQVETVEEEVVEKERELEYPKVIIIEVPLYDPPEEEIEQPFHEIPVELTQGEQDLLEQIAMAEAEGEGATGMALVMRVVLNRADLNGIPIDEVIYKPSQFAVERMGLKEPSEECHKALAMVIDGWDESQGALYFFPDDYPPYGEPLFQYGNHYFSR